MSTFVSEIRKKLVALIDREPGLRFSEEICLPFYLRVQPRFLYELRPGLIDAGIVEPDDDLRLNTLFLFEFCLRGESVKFDCKINWKDRGIEYPLSHRERLFRIYKKHGEVFHLINRVNGKLLDKWHPALHEPVLTRKEFQFYARNAGEDVTDLLERRFRRIVDDTLIRIEAVYREGFSF